MDGQKRFFIVQLSEWLEKSGKLVSRETAKISQGCLNDRKVPMTVMNIF